MSGKIVPKHLAKGVDFCGVDKYYYIVRSDLGCYMRSTNINTAEDIDIFSLHPSCRHGDYYLANGNDQFYIIKGNNYRRVKSLNTGEDANVFTLHPNCQGGDYYLSAFKNFYIIYVERGVYRRTKNMNKDEDSKEFTLHPACKDGLYYFGTKDFCYLVKPDNEWGIQYQRTTNLNENEDSKTFSVHPTVTTFLPGGLAITKGRASGEWTCIKTISNDSETPIDWQKKVTRKVGFENVKMSSIENKWNVCSTVSAETSGLMGNIAKSQFSMTIEYGGSSVNTDKETWTESTKVEETVSVTLPPHKKMYIWTYQLCLGNEPMLYCRDMRILDTTDPPTDVPLPAATN